MPTLVQKSYNMQPEAIVQKMMDHDGFSQWLGIQVLEVRLGYCRLQMKVTESMLNGFGFAHGGITYSLADSCFAFASNSHGIQAVSIETSINHLKPVKAGDTLFAVAEESNRTRKTGLYLITITNQDNVKVALFKGLVYLLDKNWV